MQIKASLNNLRTSPRKVRLVTNLIKGLDVSNAQGQLRFLNKRVSAPILKLLNSATANAKHNFDIEKNNLFISSILVGEGPTLKRWLPRAFGRATPIMKRTSHITLVLGEKSPTAEKKKNRIAEKKAGIKKGVAQKKIEKIDEEKKTPKERPEQRPYDVSTKSKKRFFSRQGIKKMFQRKSF